MIVIKMLHHKFYELNRFINNTSKKCLAILVLFCFFQLNSAFTQTVGKNEDGEKIVIYGDGSWRYFDEGDPEDEILYENSDLYKADAALKVKKDKAAKVAKTKKTKSKKEKSKKEKASKANKSKKVKAPKKSKANNKVKKSTAKAAKNKKAKGEKSSKASSNLGSIGRQNYNQKIRKKIIEIRDQQNIAFEKERVANYATSKYEREYKLAKKRKLSKAEIAKVELSYKTAKSQLKDARDQNKILLKQRRAYESLKKKSGDSIVKSYDKLARKYDANYKIAPPKNSESLVIKEQKNSKSKRSKRSKDEMDSEEQTSFEEDMDWDETWDEGVNTAASVYTVSYPSKKGDAIEAAVPKCAIAFKGKDSFSGKKRVDLEPSPLFSFTTEKMRRYFEDGDMIQCDAYMSAVAGGYKFLCVELTVASETAQKSYGSIEKQGLLSLKLVDGTTVNMYNNKTDNGSLDPLKKTVLYKAQYLIPNEHIKTLSKMDIDKVRLVWSTGYEDYTIYESDFLINQLNCLDN
jgi:hypothetical protein